MGYDVVCTRSEPRAGGVALVSKDQPEGWHFESTKTCGPNALSTVLVSGSSRTHIIGAYLPPSTLRHLPELEVALGRFPDLNPMIFGDLNADLSNLSCTRS